MGIRRNRRRNKRIVAISLCLIAVILTSFSVGYALLSERLSISGTATIKPSAQPDPPVENDFEVIVSNYGSETRYEISLSLKNTTDTRSTSWTVVFEVPEDAQLSGTPWGCSYTFENGKLTLKSTWNGEIAPGATASSIAGFTMTMSDTSFKFDKYTATMN